MNSKAFNLEKFLCFLLLAIFVVGFMADFMMLPVIEAMCELFRWIGLEGITSELVSIKQNFPANKLHWFVIVLAMIVGVELTDTNFRISE